MVSKKMTSGKELPPPRIIDGEEYYNMRNGAKYLDYSPTWFNRVIDEEVKAKRIKRYRLAGPGAYVKVTDLKYLKEQRKTLREIEE